MGVKLNQFYKNLALWLVISLMMILVYNLFNKPNPAQERVTYSDFIAAVDAGKITAVTIQGSELFGKYTDGKDFKTFKPEDPALTQKLLDKKIRITAKA